MGNVLVTGSNRGIGLEFCRQLAERGHAVIAACRRSSPELDRLGVRVEPGVAIDSADTVEALERRLDGVSLDLLVNNAGILERNGLDHLDFESVRRQLDVNAVGTLRVTHALLGHLRKGSKVTGSGGHVPFALAC